MADDKLLIEHEGRMVCPKCLDRNLSGIMNHDLTSDGRYRFEYVCKTCGAKVIDICDMNRKGR